MLGLTREGRKAAGQVGVDGEDYVVHKPSMRAYFYDGSKATGRAGVDFGREEMTPYWPSQILWAVGVENNTGRIKRCLRPQVELGCDSYVFVSSCNTIFVKIY